MQKILLILCFFSTYTLFSQVKLRVAETVRTTTAPTIDGVLDDIAWKNAPIIKDFTARQPVFGKPAHFPTEVKMVYDNTAIYIAAYLFDPEPDKIYKDLSLRDELGRGDRFEIGIDTYNDNLNGYKLIVSAANVQLDARHLPGDFDLSWDAVWESKVKINKDGWAVEIRIPYSMLRFPKKNEQLWGIQFVRMVQRVGELSTFNPSNPNVDGIVNQWGDLHGMSDIKPPFRLSLTPYLAGYADRNPVDNNGKTDFSKGYSYNGGMDVKYGINESFTLDATLIPDFGQVQSDNVVRNLSPFEVQYDERRPFFTEGTELFSRGGIFYSRRIGGRPRGFYNAQNEVGVGEKLIKNPSQTQLYNATKISGRTAGKLGIGVLNAVAAPMFAVIQDSLGNTRKFQTDVLTNYNVAVLDQIFANNSAVSLTNTNVTRKGDERDANVTAFRFNVRDKENRYDFRGKGIVDKITDKNLPDSLKTGGAYEVSFSKVSGLWQWEFFNGIIGKQFNNNDLGILQERNTVSSSATIKYEDYRATKNRLSWQNALTVSLSQRYKPFSYQEVVIEGNSNYNFKNFTQISFETFNKPLWYYDFFEPRTVGKKYRHAPFAFGNLSYQTDTRKRYNIRVGYQYGDSPIPNDRYVVAYANLKMNFNNHFKVFFNIEAVQDHYNFGFIQKESNGNIIFGGRKIYSVSNSLAITYAFNAKTNINWRIREYWNRLNYKQLYYLQDDGNLKEISKEPTQFDENFNVFNSDFVFTWQFAPGSFFNLIWKNGVIGGDPFGKDSYIENLRKTYSAAKDNTVAVKVLYFIDYNDLKKKKNRT